MATTTIDLSGSGGLAPKHHGDINKTSASPNLRYKATEGQMVSGMWNPWRVDGYLAAPNGSFLEMDVPTITDGISSGLAAGGVIFFADDDEDIVSSDDTFVDSSITYDYEVYDAVKFQSAHTTSSGTMFDLELYQINGVEKIFYVRGNDIGIANVSEGLTSPNDTWLSGTATNGFNLNGVKAFMVKADNGFAYVMDSYSVHKIDGTASGGTNGTATQDVLRFPDQFFISAAIDTRGLMWIAINNDERTSVEYQPDEIVLNGECGVYVWDRLTSVVQMRDFIPVQDASRIHRMWEGPNNEICLMTSGSNGDTQIRIYNGSSFEVVKTLGPSSYAPVRDGVAVGNNTSFWGSEDGYLWALWKNDANKYSLVQLTQITSSTLDNTDDRQGPVLIYAGGDAFTSDSGYRGTRESLYIAYKESGQNAKIVRYFINDANTISDDNGAGGESFISDHNQTCGQGDVYTPVKVLPFLSTLRSLTIYCAPGTTSDSTTIATIKTYINQSTTAVQTTTVTKADIAKGYLQIHYNRPNVNAFQIEIEWDTSKIIGADDFLPYLAILDYEPTNTHSTTDG